MPMNPGPPPTQAELRTWFNYDPATGLLTRLVSVGRRRAGSRPGSLRIMRQPSGNIYKYRSIVVRGVDYREHRLIWLYMTGEWPELEIDHINGDSIDNRWCNLRQATSQQNKHNTGLPRSNTSGAKGIYWCPKRQRWIARLRRPDGSKFWRQCKLKEDAAQAYRREATRWFGEFARAA